MHVIVTRIVKPKSKVHSLKSKPKGLGLTQGLYRDVKTSSNTKQIEYLDVSLNQFAAASHSHTEV